MKLFPCTFNVHGEHIHPLAHIVVDRLCKVSPYIFGKVSSVADCDAVVTNAPSAPPYSFDKQAVDKIDKQIIIFNDADGYAPDCDNETGFGEFVRTNPHIKLYFYREWWLEYRNPFPFQMLPFDLVSDNTTKFQVHSKSQFEKRTRDIFWSQSIHTLSRKELWEHRNELPNAFCNDNYKDAIPFDDLLNFQNDSKITIALEGGGIKCRSHCEACINSVMAMPWLRMVEAYRWIHGVNCIRLDYKDGGEGSWLKPDGRGIIDAEKSIARLRIALDSNKCDLYSIYRLGIENAERYELRNYYRDHIGENILKYV